MKKIFIALSLLVFIAGCTETDLCKGVVCQNNGVCESGDCVCPDGYEGTLCETAWRTKFIGSYAFADVCPSGTYSGTASIAVSSTNNVTILLTNFAGIGAAATISGTLTEANKISITSGTANNFTINSALGTFNNNIINWTYSITASGASENCTSTWTKQ
ncbi:MAG TPA: calcium-binding EGF-like domain-containing protein [Chitinophagales bacterium]|nr:calcium-binding EGF-like domain-containing protein [Chitinophagales bacterium]